MRPIIGTNSQELDAGVVNMTHCALKHAWLCDVVSSRGGPVIVEAWKRSHAWAAKMGEGN
jgi:hypothetical protein